MASTARSRAATSHPLRTLTLLPSLRLTKKVVSGLRTVGAVRKLTDLPEQVCRDVDLCNTSRSRAAMALWNRVGDLPNTTGRGRRDVDRAWVGSSSGELLDALALSAHHAAPAGGAQPPAAKRRRSPSSRDGSNEIAELGACDTGKPSGSPPAFA